MKIAIIDWTDSVTHDPNQHYTAGDVFPLIHMVSCGVLVNQDADGITIAADGITGGEYRFTSTVCKKQINKYIILDVKI